MSEVRRTRFPAALPLRNATKAFCAALIAFPFLCPFVAGPSINAWQLLASWFCLSLLLFAGQAGIPARSVLGWLGLGWLGVVLAGFYGGLSVAAWLPACIAIAGIATAACVGAGMVTGRAPFASTLAAGVLVAGLFSAVLGLCQYYGLADPLIPWTTSPPLGRAYGNLRQRNQFATLISMAIIAALWLHAARAPASSRTRRALVAAVVLLLIAAAASTSRTGLLQLLSIVAVASLIAHRERRDAPSGAPAPSFSLPPPLALLAMIPFYFAVAWALPHFLGSGVEGMLQRLQTRTADVHGRLVLWRNVLTLIGERPWTGWGWGELSFAHFTTSYPGARFTEILDNAHNLPLHLAVELGVPAAVLICGGFIWMVIAAKPWRERDPTRLMAWGMLGAIVLHSLLEYPLWYGPFQLVFGLCLGILWPAVGVGSRSVPTGTKPRWRKTRALPSLMAAALLAVVAYASWDYIRISQIYLPRDERLPAYADDTLSKLEGSWLFARQVDFAELTLTDVTPANAARMHALAERTLHFSPEPRVIVKLIESAELLGLDDEARAQAERFRIAFPAAFARWLDEKQGDAPAP
ncbi:O-antigen ligase [Variovorax sp. W1I1]|uniref:PglL family O-oligosaccharyltransferase n=1 Tax=Variovorax sp. W1I1 TaxID=3042309 RepID=UPI00277F9746|nr:Wzy polymerase domain-containing protein [Variovorax sp. W1I1]MDQ0611430.1 O-antigen ligase [Variovorax sp. W1I1]